MSFKPTLSTHLSQRLVLTPQLRQRIEMLQMNKLELNDLVVQQLNENPVLEELSPEELTVSPDLANIDYTDVPVGLSDRGLLSGDGAGGMAEAAGEGGESGDGNTANQSDLLAVELRGMENAPSLPAEAPGESSEARELEIGERNRHLPLAAEARSGS